MKNVMTVLGRVDNVVGAFLQRNPKVKSAVRAAVIVILAAIAKDLGLGEAITDIVAQLGG